MDEIRFQNQKLEKKFKRIFEDYKKRLQPSHEKLIKITVIQYKKYSDNEYFMYLWLIYWLVYFKYINLDSPALKEQDKKYVIQLLENLEHEIQGRIEPFLDGLYEMEDDLLIFKLTIKKTFLTFEKEFMWWISNPKTYIESPGYIIPFLTLKRSPLLSFYQDYYFKKNFTNEYFETRKYFINKIWKSGFPWEYLISILDDLNIIMQRLWVIWRIKFRKKSYFSLFNKLQRKQWWNVLDFLWARIIFDNKREIYKFIEEFEKNHVYTKKKDYIKNPKPNGYQSIHYNFVCTHNDLEFLVELQIRTQKMHCKILNDKDISHYNYTINENKWSNLFKEVHIWHKYMLKHFNKK